MSQTHHRGTRLLLLTGLLPAVACGPKYGHRVPNELVQKLPYEIRIELLEAVLGSDVWVVCSEFRDPRLDTFSVCGQFLREILHGQFAVTKASEQPVDRVENLLLLVVSR